MQSHRQLSSLHYAMQCSVGLGLYVDDRALPELDFAMTQKCYATSRCIRHCDKSTNHAFAPTREPLADTHNYLLLLR